MSLIISFNTKDAHFLTYGISSYDVFIKRLNKHFKLIVLLT